MTGIRIAVAVFAATVIGCAPRLRPLPGTTVSPVLPSAELPAGHRRIVFRWELTEPDIIARGEGAARIASPDSVRLDFFLGGGVGGGAAVLIGDDLLLQDAANDLTRRLVPTPPLLWAALGRLAIGRADKVMAAAHGQSLQADIGDPVVWRVTFIADSLSRLERVERDRVLEWVERSRDGRTVRYKHETQRRSLELVITSNSAVGAFDPAIWSLP